MKHWEQVLQAVSESHRPPVCGGVTMAVAHLALAPRRDWAPLTLCPHCHSSHPTLGYQAGGIYRLGTIVVALRSTVVY